MASTESAMGRLMESATSSIDDLLADQGFTGAAHTRATQIFSSLALLGVYCVTRKLVAHSRHLARYCI